MTLQKVVNVERDYNAKRERDHTAKTAILQTEVSKKDF